MGLVGMCSQTELVGNENMFLLHPEPAGYAPHGRRLALGSRHYDYICFTSQDLSSGLAGF